MRRGTRPPTPAAAPGAPPPPDPQSPGGPTGSIPGTEATFTFAGTDNLAPADTLRFAWRLDGGAWSEFQAATTANFTALTPGPHAFEVKARDLAGNEDPTPAQATFTVGAGGSVTITSPPAAAPRPPPGCCSCAARWPRAAPKSAWR